ncbi:WRKY transcription factor [Perilla frutescens var. frutescens]|nr:WRKY transcription factor [Perilla frutescens var. frutescens]
MDGTLGYNTTLASASKDRGKVVDYALISCVDFGSSDVLGSFVSKGSKRKCSSTNQPINLKDGSSLDLELGLSSSSCTTICSGKETEEESSLDLGLSMNLNVGVNRLSNLKKVSAGTLNAVKVRRPVIDLQLSLSTETAESDVTTVTKGFIPYKNYSKSLVLAPTVQPIDEGSTSARWKNGPLLPPLKCQQEISIPFDQDHGINNPTTMVALNISPTAVATPSSAGTACSVVVNRQRKVSVKTCQFEGCSRGARGASGLCIAHGGGRRCQKDGCQKGAEGRTVFCKAHGGGRRCQHLGCTKSAEGRTDYCIGHGGGRRCSHERCTRAARGRSGLCIRHGGGKRCIVENCTKSAEGIAGLCISHGGGRRCQYSECTKGAQGSTMFCKAHGGGRRCTFLGCTKGAEGSTPYCKGHGGGKRCTSEGCTKSVHGGTLFCVSHGGGKRCAVPECTKSARGRTNYCVRHGGGKRCKFDECPKSAQGSTDFCKAHGGGKRCCWGHLGSGFGSCDKFSRGKSGLCAAHSAQVQEEENNDDFTLVSALQGPSFSSSTLMNDIFAPGASVPYHGTTKEQGATSMCSIGFGHPQPQAALPFAAEQNLRVVNASWDNLSLPEGRVHGGSLMAFLGGATNRVEKGSG